MSSARGCGKARRAHTDFVCGRDRIANNCLDAVRAGSGKPPRPAYRTHRTMNVNLASETGKATARRRGTLPRIVFVPQTPAPLGSHTHHFSTTTHNRKDRLCHGSSVYGRKGNVIFGAPELQSCNERCT